MKNLIKQQGLSFLAVTLATVSLIIGVGSTGPQGIPGSSGLNGLPGSVGPIGPSGSNGEDGLTPFIGFNGNWWIGEVDSGIPATGGTYQDLEVPYHTFSLSPQEIAWMEQIGQIDFNNLEAQADYVATKVSEGYVAIDSASAFFGINNPSGNYVLSADIDFSSVTNWAPIFFADDQAFEGILDGAGFRLLNLSTSSLDNSISLDYFGLFRSIRFASILNLTLENFTFDIRAIDRDVSKNYVGVLAGSIEFSFIRFLTLKDITLSGVQTVGGLASTIGNSQLYAITSEGVDVEGHNYVGGLIGEGWNNTIFDITTDTQIEYKSGNIGGLVGSSYFSRYLEVSANTVLASPITTDSINRVGGLTGNSYDDRFYQVSVAGQIDYTPSADNLMWEEVGGLTGYAQNTVYKEVENFLNIKMDMGDTYQMIIIRSVGGIIGASEHVIIDQGSNLGEITIDFPTLGIDENLYINTEDYPIEYLGGIIGYAYGSAYLTYVLNLGIVSGVAEVGGILGSTGIAPTLPQQHVIIQRSMNQAVIRGELAVGGIVGLFDVFTDFTLLDTANTGNLFTRFGIGGLIGAVLSSIGIKGSIINSFNAGDLNAREYGVGGLIGGAYMDFNMFNPVQGDITIRNSFSTGEIFLNFNNLFEFGNDSIGSVIGYRQLQIKMLGVAYLVQEVSFDELTWNGSENVPTGITYTAEIPSIGWGNRVDMTPIYDATLLETGDTFIYRTAWNFDTIWEIVPFSNYPMVRFPFID